MFVIASPQAETGRRKIKIAQLVGRVMAHGINLEAPHLDEFDIGKMMEEKKRFVESRGGGLQQNASTEDNNNTELPTLDTQDDEETEET
jgi:hypothetical protein